MKKGDLSGGKKLESYVVSKEILGRGSFGVVCEATDRCTLESLAVKVVGKIYGTLRDLNEFKKEAEILNSLSHSNILRFKGFFEDSINIYLFTERVTGGELFSRIIEENGFEEEDAKIISRKIVSVIAYCHGKKVVHRDIKAENILFSSRSNDLDIRLIDFGFASRAEGMSLRGELGTPDYMAPEIWGGNKYYGAPVDMWALGVLVYMTLVSYPPFLHSTPMGVKNKIIRGIYEFHPEYWTKVSDEAKDFVTRLLTVDMSARMTAEQALLHPWLAAAESISDNEARACKRGTCEFSKLSNELTAASKETLRVKSRKMETSFSAPVALSRMKTIYRLRKKGQCEGNTTDTADRCSDWYLSSLSSDTAIEYDGEDSRRTSRSYSEDDDSKCGSPSINLPRTKIRERVRVKSLNDVELRMSALKTDFCKGKYWTFTGEQRNSDDDMIKEASYAMSRASICSTVSSTATDCESCCAFAKERSPSTSSYNSDDEEANYDVSKILLELGRDDESDTDSD